MVSRDSLISELEDSIHAGSDNRRLQTLRRVTDLFLAEPDRLTDEQVNIFGDVLLRLVERIETRARAELSRRLAPIHNAPNQVIQKLARDDEISVAGPVLMQSARLSNADLIEIARTRSQGHLMAIAGRDLLEIPVTDVLVDRGDGTVLDRLIKNSGAAFSEQSFAKLVDHAEKSESFALLLGRRIDIPIRFFQGTARARHRSSARKTPCADGERSMQN